MKLQMKQCIFCHRFIMEFERQYASFCHKLCSSDVNSISRDRWGLEHPNWWDQWPTKTISSATRARVGQIKRDKYSFFRRNKARFREFW